MLLGVSHGVKPHCDARQDGAQCYGALGGAVALQLMDGAAENSMYQWSNGTATILNVKKNKIRTNARGTRSSFTPSNGTILINDLNWLDGGNYTLQIFDSNGVKSEQRSLQLTIQAPVSSVRLVSKCLSQGEMRASCSSEGGGSPRYSWTLGGRKLNGAELLSGNNDSKSITLKQDVSGQLVCSVSNHVSRGSAEKMISSCGFIFIDCISNGTHISQWVLKANNTLCIEPVTTEGKETAITASITPSTDITSSSNVTHSIRAGPWYTSYLSVVGGALAALVILLAGVVAFVRVHGKKLNNKSKEDEDEQGLTYADVRIVQREGRQMPQMAEMGVEYGQVKFSERPRRAVVPAGDECVYAKVRRDR
ncbi:cell adhesion molecule 3-like [Pempheris klunzingeri]|uniref:cell adhesion molecule 3-like n=1 Tax=Pempheris klunzingeri TaxID=3127111 RepID=UPI003980A794